MRVIASDNSTPASIIAAMNATLRDSRSSFAMTRRALCLRQAASAFVSSGRSLRLPNSTLSKFRQEQATYGREVMRHGSTLRLKAEARAALPSVLTR